MWTYECASCAVDIGVGAKAFTAHPAKQKCRICGQRLPRRAFEREEWNRLQYHGACEGCREAKIEAWHGDAPGSYAWYRRNGMPVIKSDRVIGRLEAAPAPKDDPYADDNKDAYWRVIYGPEPVPGRPAAHEVVLHECYGMGVQGAKVWLRRHHGRQPEDSAFAWAADYRRRWSRLFGSEPPAVDLFTKHDVITRWGESCVICGGPFEHLDHWVPISKGGAHSLENVRPMCSADNNRKGDTTGWLPNDREAEPNADS